MKICMIVSYFNRPDFIELCLHSLSLQTRKPDQIIVCDDGSSIAPDWRALGNPIVLRQAHDGYGKERLSNKAIIETDCDYLVLSDQDCVFQRDWIAIQEAVAKPNQYVCGMATTLNPAESALVTKESISDGSIWTAIQRGYEGDPDIFCGNGSSVWRKDALAINGFDTRFGCPGPDYNFGMRLKANGLSYDHACKYTRWLHLWHDRPYMNDPSDYKSGNRHEANRLAALWATEATVTPFGIQALLNQQVP